MKKYIICCVISLVCAFTAHSQNTLDINKIPYTKFPCTYETSNKYIRFKDPTEASKYFSEKAQADISKAQKYFWTGLAFEAVGGVLTGIFNGNDGLNYAGSVCILGGTIFEAVAVSKVIGHFKWDYRRKQVDLYLNPTGATIKF